MASVEPPRKKRKGRYGVAELKTLGNELLSSASHINNLPLLLSFVSPSSPPHHVLESLLSLHSFFLPLLPKLPSSSATTPSGDDQSEFIYLAWLRSKFDQFLKSLVDVLASPQSDETLKELVLDTLMEFVKVHSTGSATFLVDLLASKYFKYIDVRYFTFISMKKLASTLEGKDVLDGTNESQLSSKLVRPIATALKLLLLFSIFFVDMFVDHCSCMESVIHNMYYAISHVPPLQGLDNTSDIEMWSSSDVDADDKPLKSQKRNKNVSYYSILIAMLNVLSSAKIAKKMKLKFTKAWITYLRLPLPLDVYKEVLANLHQAVIPHLSNPIMLCDFLTRSYDVGGVVSVMALSSLFVLMTQHGLEYPNFYEKLYALLVPSIFMAKHRARFFQLLDSCLKSPLLPAYLAASFAKKLSSLMLKLLFLLSDYIFSSGVIRSRKVIGELGSLVGYWVLGYGWYGLTALEIECIGLIQTMIRGIQRHRATTSTSVSLRKMEDGVDEGKGDHRADEGMDANLDNAKASAVPYQKSGIDHFNSGETDPKKSAAMRSSLWEIDTILHHYCPPVSRQVFALSLGNDLTVRAKTSEVNVGDFSAGSYATILGAELSRRVKQVPLAFFKATPSSLFSETDFAGWTFKCEEIPQMINDK
ncbi:hypothetical protein Fmac_031129 [Flemingia macrophylla]|uniref:CCAAT-binding factor domain-containing protein n=1 Tax=Flemingia macrophylla TaxID=520843 RepID=A0ABD1L1L8_9FABA